MPAVPLFARIREAIEPDLEQLRQEPWQSREQFSRLSPGLIGSAVRVIAPGCDTPKTNDLLPAGCSESMCMAGLRSDFVVA